MARGQPITWRNVAINDGSSSAALGNTAAALGRTAIQGLDIFSDQMQKRIDTEDARLLNEAISTALRGGPTTSRNRRVDANALQLAVERQATGRRAEAADDRAERTLQDTLLTTALQREGQDLLNQSNQFKVDHQQEVFEADQARIAAETAYKQQQTEESKFKMQEARRAYQESLRAAAAENDITNYFAEGQEKEFQQRFEEEAQNIEGWDDLTSDEQAAMYRQRRDNVYIPEVESDPYRGVKVAKKLGYTAQEYYASSLGQEDLAAQRLVAEKQAEKLLAQEEQQTAYVELAQEAATTGSLKNAVPDTSVEGGFTFVKGAKQVTEAGANSFATSQLGMDLSDDDSKALVNQVRAAFPSEQAFRTMLRKEVDDDGEPMEDAADRILADQNRVQLLAEEIARKATTAPTLGNAAGDLQTAVSATLARRNAGSATGAGGSAAAPEPEVDVFDPSAFEGSFANRGAETRTEAVNSLRENLNKLDRISSDLTFGQSMAVRTFKRNLDLIQKMPTGKQGELSNVQLEFITRQKKELEAFVKQLEKERRAALDRR